MLHFKLTFFPLSKVHLCDHLKFVICDVCPKCTSKNQLMWAKCALDRQIVDSFDSLIVQVADGSTFYKCYYEDVECSNWAYFVELKLTWSRLKKSRGAE